MLSRKQVQGLYDFSLPDTLEVPVKWKHITLGKRGAYEHCAIAMAARDAVSSLLNMKVRAFVDSSVSFYLPDNYSMTLGSFWYDDDTAKVITRFDNSKLLKPKIVYLHKPGTGPIISA